jgi:hypothetical protein
MLTLWYTYGLIPRTPIEGVIANIHALFITETASRLALTVIEHDVLEHHRDLSLTGTPDQIVQVLASLTEHSDRAPFEVFGKGLTITHDN